MEMPSFILLPEKHRKQRTIGSNTNIPRLHIKQSSQIPLKLTNSKLRYHHSKCVAQLTVNINTVSWDWQPSYHRWLLTWREAYLDWLLAVQHEVGKAYGKALLIHLISWWHLPPGLDYGRQCRLFISALLHLKWRIHSLVMQLGHRQPLHAHRKELGVVLK